MRRQFHGHDLRQADDPGLGRVVNGQVRASRFPSENRSHEQDDSFTLFSHVRHHGTADPDVRKKVQVDDFLPVHVCRGFEPAPPVASRVVDQDVDATEFPERRFHELKFAARFGDVERQCQCFDVPGPDGFFGFHEVHLVACAQDDPASLQREAKSDPSADSPARTRHDGYLFLQTQIH